MAKLKLLSTIFSKLGSLTKNNGQIIVTRDSKSLYVDLEGERIEITDWIDIDTEESLLAILTPLINKYYYTKDTNKIWRYIGGEWKCLNDSADDLAPTYTESSTLLKLSSGEKLSVAFGKISKAITDLISHIGDSVKHITSTERTNWNSAKTHADSAHARTDATKVEKSSTNGNIKINGTETTVYTHPGGTNPHGTTKSDVGLGNVGNFKAVSTVANQGLTDTEKSNARTNIGAGTSSFSGSYNDLTNKPTIPSVGNGTVTIKQAGTSKGTFTMNQSGNTTIELTDNNTTYGVATSSALGLVKSGTDITVDSSGNVSVNDDSHNHVISNVDGLQSALDGKANSSHGTHVPSTCTMITDWNSATTNGWYMASGASNAPYNAWFFGYVIAHNINYVVQEVYQFTASTDAKAIPKYIRAKMNGTWGSWTEVTVQKKVPSDAKFTDTNTWRGIQNNLTSDSTTDSLSAAQGKVLKGLVDGKAASSHTHTKSQITDFPTSLPANGGNADTVDGHHFNWSGRNGQPTWVWGGNDSSNMYVYNPSNFNVSFANRAGVVRGSYTNNGGQQNPNYFGVNNVGFLMMNTTVNGDNHYKDWIIMDCYSGTDVGGATAIGVDRQEMRAFIMGSDANRTSWTRSAELITTSNIGSQSVNYANTAGSAGSVAWGNVTGKPSSFTPASHTHSYAGSSSAGGAATSAASVVDYGNSSQTIKIGFAGAGATTSNLGYIAGYISGSDGIKIKDVNKETLKSWLGLGSAAYTNSGNYATASHTHTKSQITDFPTSLPASDVYAWAKASSKPSYTASEVGAISASQDTMLNAAIVLGKNDEYGIYPNTNNYCQLGRSNLKFWKMYASKGYFDKINDGIPITSSNIGSQSVNYANKAGSAPASDVYEWAKASSKPSYSWSEITNKPSSFTPASHTHSYLPLTGGTVNGTITADDLRSVGGLSITCAYSSTASVACDWKDGSRHALILSGEDGLSSYLGWSGSSSYATVTTIRGRTCKYSNSSGTSTLSDIRLKKDFRDLDVYDKFFDSIEPCAFRMKAGSSGRYHVGYKAQQIEQALLDSGLTTQDFGGFIRSPYTTDKDDPEGIEVHEEAGIKEGEDELSLIYTEFAAMNTYQIQKCKKEISNLKNEIAELKNIISKLNA